MRHLKKFNEEIEYNQLLDECKNIFAWILDKGYQLNINTPSIEETTYALFGSSIKEVKISKRNGFDWSDIKEDYITAFDALNEKYTITKIGVCHSTKTPPDFSTEKTYNRRLYNLTKVVNTNIDNIKPSIESISLYIKD